MTRFVGAILIAAAVSMSALAQQKEPPTENKAKEAASRAQSMKDALSKLDPLSASSRMPIYDMKYVFENGGFHITFGDLKIPVPGGGASGCFTRDLSERIENLKIVVEAIRNMR